MTRRIIMVHGRGFKPDRESLEQLWVEAIGCGLERDRGAAARAEFESCARAFAYFGDVSNEYLRDRTGPYDLEADVADRRRSLDTLRQFEARDFLGERGREHYENAPGQSNFAAALIDLVAAPLSWIGLGARAIGLRAPDLLEYWNPDSSFGSRVRRRLGETLAPALLAGDDILLVSHSLGTLIAYDNLWKLSHRAEYREVFETGHKLTRWITLGCPLGNPTVRKNLEGHRASGIRQYPANIREWVNLAAVGDYISHDRTVRDDYRAMLERGVIESIEDHRIYNLAVRYGRSNPHHGAGYLIHPTAIASIGDWLG
ncbi:MAG: hypothetical protein JRF15_12700 [Deltaproteobacteria bacterium]|jgi:hypothetical protein|nr:hypothetical protein [Deltaproteobacteria bacterium]